MPAWLNILLLIGVVVFGLIATALTIGFFWVRSHRAELRRGAERVSAEARQFGEGKPIDACVDEGLKRVDQCAPTSFLCVAGVQVFVGQCSRVATAPPDFCTTIPKPTQIMDTVRWERAECARRGRANDSRCPQIVSGLQTYCAR